MNMAGTMTQVPTSSPIQSLRGDRLVAIVEVCVIHSKYNVIRFTTCALPPTVPSSSFSQALLSSGFIVLLAIRACHQPSRLSTSDLWNDVLGCPMFTLYALPLSLPIPVIVNLAVMLVAHSFSFLLVCLRGSLEDLVSYSRSRYAVSLL
ncbi:hypothetical protein GYMLUDRAFT_736270 [Collybiopsis luxurians FD-317 M1]|uniref:Uncharacterized protein n=1 Tax=Collybiopsis luxurians FD-317 M1 TaxID=944289 RepID=A0A0D0CQT9_9AGAR|nr:hypothetical protein GYMLUDRAFT_736270 [Collybiopsis luxurians FD-317 M1]